MHPFLMQVLVSSQAAATTTAIAQRHPRSIIPLILFFAVIPLAFMIFCLRDIMPRAYSGNNKKVWMVLIIILPVLGPLLYLFVGQDKAIR